MINTGEWSFMLKYMLISKLEHYKPCLCEILKLLRKLQSFKGFWNNFITVTFKFGSSVASAISKPHSNSTLKGAVDKWPEWKRSSSKLKLQVLLAIDISLAPFAIFMDIRNAAQNSLVGFVIGRIDSSACIQCFVLVSNIIGQQLRWGVA